MGRAIHMAALYGHSQVIEYLADQGADVSHSSPSTVLPMLVLVPRTNFLPLSLHHQQQVNAMAKFNCTPLYYASYGGHTLAVRTLLARGADKNMADEKGKNALQVACDGGNGAAKNSLLGLFNLPADRLRAK